MTTPGENLLLWPVWQYSVPTNYYRFYRNRYCKGRIETDFYWFPEFSSTEQCHAPLDHRKTPAPECAADHPETADAARQKSLWTGLGDNFYCCHQLWNRSNRLHRPH